ncbi:hypothetical protein ACYULU_07950 [Breznakiellaceae bacterium SP9]
MERRDYLYHYTNIFFSEVVKETILIENWEETDFNRRYVEYTDIFLKMKDQCFAKGNTDESILEYITGHRNHIVELFNKKNE